jgi:hypothetical protein
MKTVTRRRHQKGTASLHPQNLYISILILSV